MDSTPAATRRSARPPVLVPSLEMEVIPVAYVPAPSVRATLVCQMSLRQLRSVSSCFTPGCTRTRMMRARWTVEGRSRPLSFRPWWWQDRWRWCSCHSGPWPIRSADSRRRRRRSRRSWCKSNCRSMPTSSSTRSHPPRSPPTRRPSRRSTRSDSAQDQQQFANDTRQVRELALTSYMSGGVLTESESALFAGDVEEAQSAERVRRHRHREHRDGTRPAATRPGRSFACNSRRCDSNRCKTSRTRRSRRPTSARPTAAEQRHGARAEPDHRDNWPRRSRRGRGRGPGAAAAVAAAQNAAARDGSTGGGGTKAGRTHRRGTGQTGQTGQTGTGPTGGPPGYRPVWERRYRTRRSTRSCNVSCRPSRAATTERCPPTGCTWGRSSSASRHGTSRHRRGTSLPRWLCRPYRATKAEQDTLAVALFALDGRQPWLGDRCSA